MSSSLRGVRGAVLIALAWAVVWAPVGLLVGRIADPDGSLDGVWVPIGAPPGFLCGILFSALLWVAEGHRRFDELSLVRVTTWGAVVGVMVGMLPFTIGTPSAPVPPWMLGLIVIGPIAVMSTLSAAGSLLLARRAERLNVLDAGADGAGGALVGGEGEGRLGRS